MKLTTKILIGLVLGIVSGIVAQAVGGVALSIVLALEPIGTVFIRLISMVVVPLVVASLLLGVASVGDVRAVGRIGGKALGYFLVTTVIAAMIGLGLGLAVQPGSSIESDQRDAIAAQYSDRGEESAERAQTVSLMERFVAIIPRNPVAAAANMDLLGLIFATLAFGAALSGLPAERREPVVAFFRGVNAAAAVIIDWVMKLAPYAVFVLIAGALARFGADLLQALLVYSVLVIAGELFHTFVVLSGMLKLAGISVRAFWKHVAAAPILAFSTASSNATLPVSLEVSEKNLGVSNEVASFVLPVAATLNMNGSALYKALTAVFVAQVYGVPLGGAEYVVIIVRATLAALAGVGVPGSSLVTTLIVLTAIGMGAEAAAGIALVAGLDRFLDMFRTGTNIVGDLTAAAIVAKSEGETLNA